MAEKVLMYKRFERFWHWSQAALILGLALTGFEIHGTWTVAGFKTAVQAHTIMAWLLLGLWAFAIFWHFTTGEWKNYVPTTEKLAAVFRYYTGGMFRGEPHPWDKTPTRKLNPLQRIAYLGLKLAINPAIAVTGLLYLYYNALPAVGLGLDLGVIAPLHTLAAYAMATFVLAHVYLTTTGETIFAYHKAMITGWEAPHGGAPSGKPPAPAE